MVADVLTNIFKLVALFDFVPIMQVTKNRIDRAIRAMSVGAGVVSLLVYAVFQLI